MTERVMGEIKRRARRLSNYRWIPWAIVACFVVVFAVNGGLVYFAASTWPGLTTDHAYDEGLAYNRVIDETAKEAKLGWNVTLRYWPSPGALGGKIVIYARDATGKAIDDLAFRGELIRPVEAIANVPLTFVPQGEGGYVAPALPPRAGQWDVYLSASRGSDVWHGGQRILIPAE